ncbi:hypothetical protein ACQUFE_18140, partial [Enterococcus casseliflavus]|uniref:hypothetical protein n=1 Tax=Enterococcus casseliflavus TaxID=37734 RepID=UPI003D148178
CRLVGEVQDGPKLGGRGPAELGPRPIAISQGAQDARSIPSAMAAPVPPDQMAELAQAPQAGRVRSEA